MGNHNYNNIIGIAYTGKRFSVQVPILPTLHMVNINKNGKYIFTESEKIKTEQDYKFYTEFENIVFVNDNTNTSKSTITIKDLDMKKQEKPIVANGMTGEELVDAVHKEVEGTNKVKTKNKSIKAEKLNKNDFAEWLDINYDDNTIRNLANECGLIFDDGWSKEAIIDKIIDKDKDLIISKMNQR